MAGGSGGVNLEPGDPAASQFFKVITHAAEPYMPPKSDKLPQNEIDVISKWIAGGVLDTATSTAKVKKKAEFAMASGANAGKPDGPPAMTAYAYGDPIGGFNSSCGLLLGLIAKQRDGLGRHINLSQVEGMLSLAAPYITQQSASGQTGPRLGNRHPHFAPQGVYKTMGIDAWMLVSVQRALGFPERGTLTIWLGHLLLGLAYATVVIQARLGELNPQLEEAAMDLGARPHQV